MVEEMIVCPSYRCSCDEDRLECVYCGVVISYGSACDACYIRETNDE